MNEDRSWWEEMLAELEEAEDQQTEAYYDMCLARISDLETQITINFREIDKEKSLIENWMLNQNSKLQDKIEYLSRKLEAWIKEKGQKTLNLPHGTIRLRKLPDRVEIIDLEAFMAAADGSLLAVIPSTAKPDLNKIKSLIKSTGSIPSGVNFIEGIERFTFKTNNKEN
jgi:phage host-nuclease inhibitor protein Gam